MAWVKGKDRAAEALGVKGETLRKWSFSSWWKPEFVRRAGKTNEYDIDAIKAANSRYDDESGQAHEATVARKMSLQRRAMELRIAQNKLDEQKRRLLPVDALMRIFQLQEKILANNLEQAPRQLARLASDKKTRERLDSEGKNIIRRLLRMASEDLRRELERHVNG